MQGKVRKFPGVVNEIFYSLAVKFRNLFVLWQFQNINVGCSFTLFGKAKDFFDGLGVRIRTRTFGRLALIYSYHAHMTV